MSIGIYPYRSHPMRLRPRTRKLDPNHTHDFCIPLGTARMTTVEATRDCLCLLKCKEDTPAMIDVVEVTGLAGKRATFKIVRGILDYTTNISSLTLRLSFEPTSRMLQNLKFKDLTIFVTNIPHATVAPFLARHPGLTNLTLDRCNAARATAAAPCPLIHSYLPLLEELSCPKGCVWPLLSDVTPASPLYNLRIVQYGLQDSAFPLQGLFNFHRIPTSSHLDHLYLEFDHTPTALLKGISTAAPLLHTLKLVESEFSDKDDPSLWDNAQMWEDGLLSLTWLQRLLIRTPRSLTIEEEPASPYESGDDPDSEALLELRLSLRRQRENDVIRQWLVMCPPCLTEVRIWTKAFAGRANGERLAVWMLKSDIDGRSGPWWEVVDNHPIIGEEVFGGDFI